MVRIIAAYMVFSVLLAGQQFSGHVHNPESHHSHNHSNPTVDVAEVVHDNIVFNCNLCPILRSFEQQHLAANPTPMFTTLLFSVIFAEPSTVYSSHQKQYSSRAPPVA